MGDASLTVSVTWLAGLGATWAGLIAGAVWLITRQATEQVREHLARHASEEEAILKEMGERVSASVSLVQVLHERVEGLSTQIRSAPSVSDVHSLAIQMTTVSGEVRTISASLTHMRDLIQRAESVLARHDTYLLEKGIH